MKDYLTIPDGLCEKDLEAFFVHFLKNVENSSRDEFLHELEYLFELAICQAELKKSLTQNISNCITNFLVSRINYNSYEEMDYILSIVLNLYLKEVYEMIRKNIGRIKSDAVIKMVEDSIEKYGHMFNED